MSQDLHKNISTPYVMLNQQQVIGYYTLCSAQIEHHNCTQTTLKQVRYPNIPCVLMGRLAVDENYQGEGLGAQLLHDALQRCLEARKTIAMRYLMVDALDEQAKKFYLQYGFEPIPSDPMKLLLLL